MKILFWCQGAGEFAIAQYLIDYCIEQGDNVVVCLDSGTTRIVSPEQHKKYALKVYDIQSWDIPGELTDIINAYKPDVFVMQPSRTWQLGIERPNAKLCIALECNCLFRGMNSCRLDVIKPDWLDFMITTFDEPFSLESCRLMYGTDTLPEVITRKWRSFGWFAKKSKRVLQDYIFVYTGSSVTGNVGYAQKIVDAIGKDETVFLINPIDPVIGNFPNLNILGNIPSNLFEELLMGCKYAICHEGYGTIGKCLMNKIPFVSIRNNTKMKWVETEGFNTLGYGKAIDSDNITSESIKPNPVPDIDFEWGVPLAHQFIKNNL